MNRLLFALVAVLVTAALIGGFWVVGGPQQGRFEAQDRERLADMRRIGHASRCEAGSYEGADAPGCVLLPEDGLPRDPVTDAAYTRDITEDGLLRVCGEMESRPDRVLALAYRDIKMDGQTACMRFRLGKNGRWVIAG